MPLRRKSVEKLFNKGNFYNISPKIVKFGKKICVFNCKLLFLHRNSKKGTVYWHKSIWVKPAWSFPFCGSITTHSFKLLCIILLHMKKYIRPVTEIESLLLETSILGTSDFASSDDMVMYDGLPVRGDSQQDPIFNSNKFNSDGYWWPAKAQK